METFYSVTRNGTHCGKVSVRQQGLYYCFHCRCDLDRKDVYRLTLLCTDTRENLGVLAPCEDSFTLSVRIPVKRLKAGDWSFQIVSSSNEMPESFVPICPDEPFAYISRLKESFLVNCNGQQGIQIAKLQEP